VDVCYWAAFTTKPPKSEPNFSVESVAYVRRLHDTGRSGWWFLVSFVPVVGHFVMLLFMVQEGQPDSNQYGLDPKLETPEDL
jgi:uncharacterized membrane protein YhaH (DUF805 family)